MRTCLVGAATLAESDDLGRLREERIDRLPLGVLALASVLRRGGLRAEVVDLDTLYAAWRATSLRRGGFARYAAEDLARQDAEVYGFSTICGSYPLTLRIAAALKDRLPGCRVVFGGPQASATACETLEAFPAVDVVVRGEGEHVLPALLDALEASRDLSSLRGISYRNGLGITQTPDAPPIENLDLLPFPAYDLYPKIRDVRSLPVEAGRGCPFSCTFCSTSRFFGRKFRLKSARRILEDMLALRAAYGIRNFELVHDNLTVDRRRVVELCETISSSGERFTWTCSSRTDTLDDHLVDMMKKAGCRGIFFGVESGSPDVQRSVRKRLDLEEARARLRRVNQRRIPAAVAFIAGFPDETGRDLEATVDFFVESLRGDYLDPQLGLLAPLAGTPLHARHRGELVHDEVVSDVAFQGERLDPADEALIQRYPILFSSYWSVPTRWLDRRDVYELRAFLLNARFDLRWLLVAAAQVAGGGTEVYREFRAWRPRPGRRESPRAITAYYRSQAFRHHFIRFVRARIATRSGTRRSALYGLATYYACLNRRAPVQGARSGPRSNLAPVVAPDVRVARLGCDGAALVQCVRRGGDLAAVPRRNSTLVTRLHRGRNEILRVSEEAGDLLELCDGTRSASAVATAFRRRHPQVNGVPGEIACAAGIAMLQRRGLLRAHPGSSGRLRGSRTPRELCS